MGGSCGSGGWGEVKTGGGNSFLRRRGGNPRPLCVPPPEYSPQPLSHPVAVAPEISCVCERNSKPSMEMQQPDFCHQNRAVSLISSPDACLSHSSRNAILAAWRTPPRLFLRSPLPPRLPIIHAFTWK